jgi:ABC-2 type transport system permease protein
MKPSVEATLAWLTLRQTMADRRALGALVLALVPVVLAALARGADGDPLAPLRGFSELFTTLMVPVLLPIVALVVGTGAFGNEVEDGTITYVLGKPVARWRIVLTRIVVAGALTALVIAPSTFLTGVVAIGGLDPTGAVLGFTAAMVIGSFLYCALFVAISLSTRRSLIAGLAYVVIWEGALAANLAGTRALSVRQYTLSFAEMMSRVPGELFTARLDGSTAVPMAVLVAGLATAHAILRLRRFEIGEAS